MHSFWDSGAVLRACPREIVAKLVTFARRALWQTHVTGNVHCCTCVTRDTQERKFRACKRVNCARGQYSSLGEGAFHMEEGVQVRVQAECGREEVGERKRNMEKDKTRKRATDNQPLTMDGMSVRLQTLEPWLGHAVWTA